MQIAGIENKGRLVHIDVNKSVIIWWLLLFF